MRLRKRALSAGGLEINDNKTVVFNDSVDLEQPTKFLGLYMKQGDMRLDLHMWYLLVHVAKLKRLANGV
jgi:hypothetical protein